MTLTPDDLEQYSKHRAKSVGGTSIKKELGGLKGALTWGIDNKLIPSSPINRWPAIKTKRQKPFEWKSDIDAISYDAVRVILQNRQERPVGVFCLDGRPHLKLVQVEAPNLGAYRALVGGGAS
jgi:hypothetical protein